MFSCMILIINWISVLYYDLSNAMIMTREGLIAYGNTFDSCDGFLVCDEDSNDDVVCCYSYHAWGVTLR